MLEKKNVKLLISVNFCLLHFQNLNSKMDRPIRNKNTKCTQNEVIIYNHFIKEFFISQKITDEPIKKLVSFKQFAKSQGRHLQATFEEQLYHEINQSAGPGLSKVTFFFKYLQLIIITPTMRILL